LPKSNQIGLTGGQLVLDHKLSVQADGKPTIAGQIDVNPIELNTAGKKIHLLAK